MLATFIQHYVALVDCLLSFWLKLRISNVGFMVYECRPSVVHTGPAFIQHSVSFVVFLGWGWMLAQRCTHRASIHTAFCIPFQQTQLANVGTMLAHRLRRWANIIPTLAKRLGFSRLLFSLVKAEGIYYSGVAVYSDNMASPPAGTRCTRIYLASRNIQILISCDVKYNQGADPEGVQWFTVNRHFLHIHVIFSHIYT